MLTSTSNAQSTVVNAAFLQEVKDSNTELWPVVYELRELQVVTDDLRETSRRLVRLLGELRDCIALQFSLEETYGFITGVKTALNIVAGDAGLAKSQHRELYLQLHELCEQVEEAQYRGTIGRDLAVYLAAFAEFDEVFSAHEELESELICCGFGLRSALSRK